MILSNNQKLKTQFSRLPGLEGVMGAKKYGNSSDIINDKRKYG
jgi:hypothetical protein